MILFINPLGPKISYSIYNDTILIKTIHGGEMRDFETIPETLHEIQKTYNIQEIWCITGPGPFTKMRILTLSINTFHIASHITLKGIHFFSIIPKKYHPTIKANESEYIIASGNNETELIPKEKLENKLYCGYGEKNDFTDPKNFIEYIEDWPYIRSIFSHITPVDRISPIYLKDPHITCSKKNTYHS